MIFVVYLIDDVLASLDAHVSKHIVKHCILDILKDRTRIIVTENRTLFYYSNQILHVEGGTVSTSDFSLGSFESEHLESESSTSSELSTPINFDLNNDDYPSSTRSVFEEKKETGSLSSRVFAVYWKAWGPSLCLLVIISLIFMQVSRNISDTWLALWIKNINTSNSSTLPEPVVEDDFNSESSTDDIKQNLVCFLKKIVAFGNTDDCVAHINTNSTLEDIQATDTGYYLAVYIGIVIFNSLIALVRAFAFAYGGIKAAKLIHDRLLNSVIHTEFSFFDVTPVGRIMNRFSSDTNTIDDSLPFILNILLAQLAGLIGALCVTLFGMPWLTLLIIPMCPIYFDIQSRYRKSSRDIKRLSSNALSPIYTHFTETGNENIKLVVFIEFPIKNKIQFKV